MLACGGLSQPHISHNVIICTFRPVQILFSISARRRRKILRFLSPNALGNNNFRRVLGFISLKNTLCFFFLAKSENTLCFFLKSTFSEFHETGIFKKIPGSIRGEKTLILPHLENTLSELPCRIRYYQISMLKAWSLKM